MFAAFPFIILIQFIFLEYFLIHIGFLMLYIHVLCHSNFAHKLTDNSSLWAFNFYMLSCFVFYSYLFFSYFNTSPFTP